VDLRIKNDVEDKTTSLAKAQADISFRIIQGLCPAGQQQDAMDRDLLDLIEDRYVRGGATRTRMIYGHEITRFTL
jgi:hypothetical protein